MKNIVFFLLFTCVFVVSPNEAWSGPLPDTGQTRCYNNTGEITCPQPGENFYGQDGNYLINPPSYTKLDTNGNYLADSATSWVMVRDNVTGLIWEVKTDDGSIHDKDIWYSWQDAQDVFVGSLNSVGFGGYSDWRLPTIKELAFIVNYGRSNPTIDTTYFPNTFWSMQSAYWSSTTNASYPSFAWTVTFYFGRNDASSKSNACYVRAVRGGQSENSSVDNGEGTVTDTATGLMWQKPTAPGTYWWEKALLHCEGLTLAGYTDWRLPSIKELRSIVDYDRYGPAIDTAYFPDTLSSGYWSSTTSNIDKGYACSIDFSSGYSSAYSSKSYSYYVRAVRGGQNRLLGHLVILTPDQASSWNSGDSMAITWETQGISGNVKISISRQGGKDGTFETITDSTENDGTYNWTVTGTASVNCVLKVEPIDDASKGTTQGLFTIYSVPTVTTDSATSVTANSATLNGTVNPNGASTTYYFDYGATASYGSTTASTSAGTGTGDVSVNASLNGLTSYTTYHFRIVATNTAGTNYGSDQTFTTSASAPTAKTGSAASVSSGSATLNGTVNANGATTTVVFEYGTSMNYGSTVTATQSPLSGSGSQNVSAGLTGLAPGTTYYFRVKATNSGGTAYGDGQAFTTLSPPVPAPTVTTGSASQVTSSSATLNGTVNPNGAGTNYYFEYGTTTGYGSATASAGAGSGSSNVSVTANLTGLSTGTSYHYRLIASNNGGTAYGDDQTFTTSTQNLLLSIGSGSGKKGQEITLPITLTNMAGTDIAAVSVDVGYDTGVFRNPKGALGPAGQAAGKTVETNDVSSGVFRVSVFSTSNNRAIGNGVVAYLTLKIEKDAPLGTTELANTPSASNTEGYAVTVDGTDGSVNVVDYDPGDCNEDGRVSISEVQYGINMFLGINPVEDCVDVNQNGRVSIGELQKVINNHMGFGGAGLSQDSRGNGPTLQDYTQPGSKAHEGISIPKVSIGRKTASPGEKVRVAITLNNAPGYDVSALSTDITYDSKILLNPSVEIGPAGTAAGKSIVFNEISTTTIRVGVISASNNNPMGDGVVAYVSFDIKDDASVGQTTLANAPGASDPSGNDITVSGTNGLITIMTVIYVSRDGTCGGNSPCYSRIQDALDSEYDLATIKAEEGTYDEGLIFDKSKQTVLEGGWDSTFSIQSSKTTIKSITFNGGALEIKQIVLQ